MDCRFVWCETNVLVVYWWSRRGCRQLRRRNSTDSGKWGIPIRILELGRQTHDSQLVQSRPQWYLICHAISMSPFVRTLCWLWKLEANPSHRSVHSCWNTIKLRMLRYVFTVFTVILWGMTLGFCGLSSPADWQAASALYVLGNLGKYLYLNERGVSYLINAVFQIKCWFDTRQPWMSLTPSTGPPFLVLSAIYLNALNPKNRSSKARASQENMPS